MADDAAPSEVPVSVDETLNVSEVTTKSNSQVGVESTAQTTSGSGKESVERVEKLMKKGSKAMDNSDFIKAVDCYSRALEIRTARYGELAPECLELYYTYGLALLFKAQEEVDPLEMVPKKESSKASVSNDVSSKKNRNEEEADDSDGEDIRDVDADEADLDLAWKMLDVARAIVEKNSGDTMEKVDIWTALAEVELERDDIETSLIDYQKALSILEGLVEPDYLQLSELNFCLCLCLESKSQLQEAISFCQKAISICNSRVLRLTDEVKGIVVPTTASSTSGSEPEVPLSSNDSQVDNTAIEKQSEIDTLSELLVELEKHLQDLERQASNQNFICFEDLGIGSDKANIEEITPSQMGSANNDGGLDSPTVSTAHTKGSAVVTHIGIVGRGVKRVSTISECVDSNPGKKLAIDSSSSQDKGDESSA